MVLNNIVAAHTPGIAGIGLRVTVRDGVVAGRATALAECADLIGGQLASLGVEPQVPNLGVDGAQLQNLQWICGCCSDFEAWP